MAENSSRTAPGRPFQPGQSGNPGGRPKLAAEARALAQEHGPDAIKRLVELMKCRGKQVSTAVRACEAILDRAYGKAPQSIDLPEGTVPTLVRVEFVDKA